MSEFTMLIPARLKRGDLLRVNERLAIVLESKPPTEWQGVKAQVVEAALAFVPWWHPKALKHRLQKPYVWWLRQRMQWNRIKRASL